MEGYRIFDQDETGDEIAFGKQEWQDDSTGRRRGKNSDLGNRR